MLSHAKVLVSSSLSRPVPKPSFLAPRPAPISCNKVRAGSILHSIASSGRHTCEELYTEELWAFSLVVTCCTAFQVPLEGRSVHNGEYYSYCVV